MCLTASGVFHRGCIQGSGCVIANVPWPLIVWVKTSMCIRLSMYNKTGQSHLRSKKEVNTNQTSLGRRVVIKPITSKKGQERVQKNVTDVVCTRTSCRFYTSTPSAAASTSISSSSSSRVELSSSSMKLLLSSIKPPVSSTPLASTIPVSQVWT